MLKLSALVALATSVIVLAGCGSADDSPSGVAPTDGELSGTTFDSTDVTGRDLVPGSLVTIGFQEDSISANAGCNSMSGTYAITDGTLEVGVVAATEMACDDALMAQDLWLGNFITNGPSIVSFGETLTLTGDDVAVSLAVRPAAELEGTTWVVTGATVGDMVSTTPNDTRASMTITDGVAAIETGCNRGSSNVEVAETTITFGPMMLTRMACPSDQAALERAVTAVLDGEVSYELDDDTLVIRAEGTDDGIGLTFAAN